MFRSGFLICFLISLSSEASVQKTFEGFIGGSALFPCYYDPSRLKLISAHWRLNDSLNVYDILSGRGTDNEQDPQFKGRTETFPTDYMKGNFSLRLRGLTWSDVGAYCCSISDVNSLQCTTLQVKERPREIHEKPDRNVGVESNAERIVSQVLACFFAVILLCVWVRASCSLLKLWLISW